MDISVIGLTVWASIWLLGCVLGSGLVIGLIASVAFGSTAVVTLSALGGSSPLIYMLFALLLVGSAAFDRDFISGLTRALRRDWVGWVVGVLMVYAAAGAYIMPRLFAGATNAFVAARDVGVVEVSLAPVSANITQTGYFLLGGLTFFVLLSRLVQGEPMRVVRTGFFTYIAVNALGGIVDLAAKTAGAGDVLAPIRTATFAFLTDVEQGGFARINGTYSEASAFGGTTLACLAFSFTYWRQTGSLRALLAVTVLVSLLVLSTSSTAYAGLAIMVVPLVVSLVSSVSRGRFESYGLIVVGCIAVAVTITLFIMAYDPTILEPFERLFQTTVLDKADSESGRERSHWNERSLTSFFETSGLGIGFGSSRASNWLVAVVSQLGVVGTALQLSLLIPFLRRPNRPHPSDPAHEVFVLQRSLSAFVLASLAASIVGGGGADPGILFFIALAGVLGGEAQSARIRQQPEPASIKADTTARPSHGLATTASA